MKSRLILVAAFFCTLAASQMAHAQVKLGILLTLSGPLGAQGKLVLDAIRKTLADERQIQIVVYDDEAKADMAVARADRMISEDKVGVVIGPLTVGLTGAVAPRFAAARLPVISLAAPSRARLTSLIERNPRLVMFAPIPGAHVDAVGTYLKESGRHQVSFAYFSPGSADYAEELAGQLGKTVGRFDSVLKAPVGTSAEAQRFAQQIQEKPSVVVLGTLAEPLADELATRFRRANLLGETILFSPPRAEMKGRLAATLVLDAVKKEAKTPEDVFRAIESSRLYRKELRTLAVDWTVVTYGTKAELMKQLKAAASGDTTSCSCNSKDGKVCKQKNCPTSHKCKKEEKEDDCMVDCVAS